MLIRRSEVVVALALVVCVCAAHPHELTTVSVALESTTVAGTHPLDPITEAHLTEQPVLQDVDNHVAGPPESVPSDPEATARLFESTTLADDASYDLVTDNKPVNVSVKEEFYSDLFNEDYPSETDDFTDYYGDPAYRSDDYYPLPSQPFVYEPEFFSNLTLRKCHCGAQQIWDGKECQDSQETPTAVEDPYGHATLVNTSWFGSIQNGPLVCRKHYTKVHYHSPDLVLRANMKLFSHIAGYVHPIEDYCIDHILIKEERSWEAEACVPPPRVHRCCPAGDVIERETGDCMPAGDGTQLLHPPVDLIVSNSTFEYVDATLKNVTCGDSMSQRWVDLRLPLNGMVHTPEGAILVFTAGVEVTYVQPNDYCVAQDSIDAHFWAHYCPIDHRANHKEFCKDATCVRKCCPEGSVFDTTQHSCFPAISQRDTWVPHFHEHESGELVETQQPEDLKIISGFPLCGNTFSMVPSENPADVAYLLSTGRLHVPDWSENLNATDYCIDNFAREDGRLVEQLTVCFPATAEPVTACGFMRSTAYPILAGISAVFLLITVLVYWIVPDLHSKVHGKSLLSYVSALFLFFTFLSIIKWFTSSMEMSVCVILVFVIQICSLSSFFWLNVMCFDIYWTLRSLRPIAEGGEGAYGRFVWYMAYAWGGPLVIGVVTIAMHQLDPGEYPNLVLPGFGVNNCWFHDTTALWVYLYSFILVITVVNSVLFMLVAQILYKAHRANRTILKASQNQDAETQVLRFKLYFKLFIVMGVTWVCEVISWNVGPCELWFLTDSVNALQGFAIFYIFVCKRNIYLKVKARIMPRSRGVKRVVRNSSYANNESQRTNLSMDSIRDRSSMSKKTSFTTAGSFSTSMHAIPEQPEQPSYDPSYDRPAGHDPPTGHDLSNASSLSLSHDREVSVITSFNTDEILAPSRRLNAGSFDTSTPLKGDHVADLSDSFETTPAIQIGNGLYRPVVGATKGCPSLDRTLSSRSGSTDDERKAIISPDHVITLPVNRF